MRWLTLRRLKSPQREVRLRAIERLAADRDRRTVPALVSALRESGGETRRAIVKALGAIGHPSAVLPLIEARAKSKANRQYEAQELTFAEARDALASLGPGAIDTLVGHMGSDEVVAAIGKIGRPAISKLIPLLDDPARRCQVADALSMMGAAAAEVVPALCRVVQDGGADSRFRASAAGALGDIGGDPDRVVPLLCRILDDDRADRLLHVRALSALSRFDHSAGTTTLLSVFQKGSRDDRSTACHGLARTRDPRTIPLLVEALVNPACDIREQVADALQRLGWEPTTPGHRAWLHAGRSEFAEAAALGPAAVPALLARLDERMRPARTDDVWSAVERACKSATLQSMPGDALACLVERLPGRPAATTLRALGWQPGDDRERALLLVADGHVERAIGLGPAAADALERKIAQSGRPRASAGVSECEPIFALARLGDPRAVEPLLALVGGWMTDSAAEHLELVLRQSAASIAVEHLAEIAKLSQVSYSAHELGEGLDVRPVKRSIDCRQLAELAGRELRRRHRQDRRNARER